MIQELFDKIVYGFPHSNDVLWKLTKDDQVEVATEYNQEVTGFSEGLKDIITYGDNAYYWLWSPGEFQRQGWTVERVETRGQKIYIGEVNKEEKKVEVKHELKSWTGLFEPIFKGEKTHELRVLDRDYQIGDICLLREYNPLTKEYTGRECCVEITYITSSQHQECAFSPFALHEATGILSIRKIDDGLVDRTD